jgi:RNA polymerase sigma-70 factor, ECF subfamily
LPLALFYENVVAGGRDSPTPLTCPSMSHTESQYTDESFVREAVRRVLDGDIEAFAVVINRYQRLVAADLSRRLPAQDVQEVAQDAFLRAFRSLPSYRGEAPVRIWLLRIVRHAAMDFWRRRYRRRDRLFADIDEAGMVHLESLQQERQAERQADRDAGDLARETLGAALKRLSPDDRAVITLVELEERSMQEAARELGCGLSAVKVRAFRARRRLKNILEEIALHQEDTT